jgi:type I restriction enzyme, S subunit
MREWKECRLGDVADIQTGPFGSQLHASDYTENGIPSIMPTNIGDRLEIDERGIARINNEDARRLLKYLVEEGDIVYSRRGDVEKCAYISSRQHGWLCGTGCLRIRVVSDRIISKYCAYYLSTDEIKQWILNSAVGTTMPNLNSSVLQKLPVQYPSVPEQRAVVGVLSSLDDKIDLLHRQNKTLEGMAEALWRKVFVKEADQDWDDVSLLELIDLVGGGTPKTEIAHYWDGAINWLSAKDITANHKGFVVKTEKTITDAGLGNSSAKLLPQYSTVISARGTVGNYCVLSAPMAFSQSNYGILPKVKQCYFFTYLLVAHVADELKMAAYGSVFDTITTSTFREQKIQIPSEDQIILFEKKIRPYFDKICANTLQIRTLSRLRDTLLPKLMSGEVRVRL